MDAQGYSVRRAIGRYGVGLAAWAALWVGMASLEPIAGTAAGAEGRTVQQAVEQGLAYLAAHQQADGSYGSGTYRGNVAVTAFVGRAMLAAGSKPGAGPYGDRLTKSVDFLLGRVQDNGIIASLDAREPGPMYGHAFALMFLAECQKVAPRQEAKEKMGRAGDLIVKSQNRDGGWRYQPRPLDADLSVTVTQLMALLNARDAGLDVPQATVDRAIEYVKRSQNDDGGFRYLIQGGTSAFARSAAAVAALYHAGGSDWPEVRQGLQYVTKFPPAMGIGQPEVFYFYGHYYAAQAVRHARAETWNAWYEAVRDRLLAQQRQDGAWPDAASVDLGTAMACLTLQTTLATK